VENEIDEANEVGCGGTAIIQREDGIAHIHAVPMLTDGIYPFPPHRITDIQALEILYPPDEPQIPQPILAPSRRIDGPQARFVPLRLLQVFSEHELIRQARELGWVCAGEDNVHAQLCARRTIDEVVLDEPIKRLEVWVYIDGGRSGGGWELYSVLDEVLDPGIGRLHVLGPVSVIGVQKIQTSDRDANLDIVKQPRERKKAVESRLAPYLAVYGSSKGDAIGLKEGRIASNLVLPSPTIIVGVCGIACDG
jgi:hypothetical protein